MKIIYIANILYPSEYGHSLQITKMCQAFANNGNEVVLLIPSRLNKIKIDAEEYYGIKRNYRVVKVPSIDFIYDSTSRFMYWIRFLSFYISAKVYVAFHDYDLLYSRDIYSTLFFKNILLELHYFPKLNFILNKLIQKRVKKINTLTSYIKNKFVENGINEKNIMVAPDAVDLSNYDGMASKVSVKTIEGNYVIGYVGALKTMGMDKGINDSLEALKSLPENFRFLIIGGEVPDVEYYKKVAEKMEVNKKTIFIGKVPHNLVPEYMKLCDCLVAPFPETEHYSYYMSPLKIFEYMASKKPIITTDLPSLREVLVNGENSILISPGSYKELSDTILMLSNNKELSEKISRKAYEDVVSKFTWDIRVKKILKFI